MRLKTTFVALLVCVVGPAVLLAGTQPSCLPNTQQTFNFTGSPQVYNVPVTATVIYVQAQGASGGEVVDANDPLKAQTAGLGVLSGAEFPVGGGEALQVLVGGEGQLAEDDGGGGGGGSFVFTSGGTLLLAASGGGGAGISGDGYGGSLGEDGVNGGDATYGGTGGTAGQGGGAATGTGEGGGGGGGWLSAGGTSVNPGSGEGGHQISSPGDAAGGAGGGTAGTGGYGGGGGGSDVGGGGGGGYSGGGGGWGEGDDGGGGGGSYVDAGGTSTVSTVFTTPGNGTVMICVLEEVPVELQAFTID